MYFDTGARSIICAFGEEYKFNKIGLVPQKTNSEESWTYSWDLHNRLVKVTRSDGDVIEYTYDAENTKYYTVTDYHGSVVQVLDSTGSCVWSASYSAYGKITKDDSGFDFEGLYTGQEIDEDTGLTYHWMRWRNEEGDAFISEDPVMYVDPDGLKVRDTIERICKSIKEKYDRYKRNRAEEKEYRELKAKE